MNKLLILLALLTILISCTKKAEETYNQISNPTYKLVWSDEFDGTEVDLNKWTFETGIGTNGWGNNELQYYKTENTTITEGALSIVAKQEDYGGKNYTSSRLITRGKYGFTYGKAEIRAKLPKGQGVWPAIWMLGSDIGSESWPACGEVDIMELLGHEPNKIYGTAHGPGYSGSKGMGKSTVLSQGTFSDDFHVFSIEWDKISIKWYVDGILYHSIDKTEIEKIGTWVFNNDFFLLLNVAVGGDWPGSPDSTTIFPQTMTVDYVRIYQKTN